MLQTVIVAMLMNIGPAAEPELPRPIATELFGARGVAVDDKGQIFVTVDRVGDSGGVVLIDDQGKKSLFATGLDNPQSIVWHQQNLFVAGYQQVWRIDSKGTASVFAPSSSFPNSSMSINNMCVDFETGRLIVTRMGSHPLLPMAVAGDFVEISPKGKVTRLKTAGS